MPKELVRLINGPLHGYELETDSEEIDLLDSLSGKVRRYIRPKRPFAVFSKEWATQQEWEEERQKVSRGDNPTGS